MTRPSRILMLGLDAADHDVVMHMANAGRLPVLAALMRRGISGPLHSPANHYAGGVWPTFYTGRPVADHGVFHNKQWRPEHMRIEVPTDEWTAATPFWEAWRDSEIASVILDVPMVLGRPRPLNGVYVGGWGTHDLIARGSSPTPLWRELERRFGPPLMPREAFGWQTDATLDALATRLRNATAQLRDIAIHLLERHAWRFACVVFGGAHRGGHYLWDRSQTGCENPTSALPDESLLGVYEALDAAVGEVLRHVPEETLVLVFAVHGMGPNPGWSDLLPTVLARLAEARGDTRPRGGSLFKLKQAVPHHWVRPYLTAMPEAFHHRLVELWSTRMHDWSRTRHFPMPMDEAGYLRISLRGRERDGIVAPGNEYERLCTELEELLGSLCDAATGTAIAGPVHRAFLAETGRKTSARLVPDLVIPWSGPAASATQYLKSRLVPGFRFTVPRRLPSGRSGNHRGVGWFAASGPGVREGVEVRGYDILDLLPTVLTCLGRATDASQLPGRIISEIVHP